MSTVKLHGLVPGIQDDLFTGLSSNLLFKPIEDSGRGILIQPHQTITDIR